MAKYEQDCYCGGSLASDDLDDFLNQAFDHEPVCAWREGLFL